jgi:hypothetical protein
MIETKSPQQNNIATIARYVDGVVVCCPDGNIMFFPTRGVSGDSTKDPAVRSDFKEAFGINIDDLKPGNQINQICFGESKE